MQGDLMKYLLIATVCMVGLILFIFPTSLTLPPPHITSIPATILPTSTHTLNNTPPMATITPTPISTDAINRVSTSTPTPTTIPGSIFLEVTKPLFAEALKRRTADPNFMALADADLNRTRLNFLLFGFGETYEPPNITLSGVVIGSPTIISYDLLTNKIAIISLTHDIRVPEVERALGLVGKIGAVVRLDRAYLDPTVGGFPMLRNVIASATGLWPDYQVAMSDVLIADLVRDVLGNKLEVEVPLSFTAHPVYLNGILQKEKQFTKGFMLMDGVTTIQYIKSVPVYPGAYPPVLEHNVRKAFVFTAIRKSFEANPLQILALTNFISAVTDKKKLAFDFDVVSLGVNNVRPIITGSALTVVGGRKMVLGFPETALEKYIVDYELDPGHLRAIHWVGQGRDKFIDADFATGVYQSGSGIEVPFDANPYGDLVTVYWPSLRNSVRQLLKEVN